MNVRTEMFVGTCGSIWMLVAFEIVVTVTHICCGPLFRLECRPEQLRCPTMGLPATGRGLMRYAIFKKLAPGKGDYTQKSQCLEHDISPSLSPNAGKAMQVSTIGEIKAQLVEVTASRK